MLKAIYDKYDTVPKLANGVDGPAPNSRICIAGPSGCGKTTLLINFLFKENIKIRFTRLYICAKDLDEVLYRYLRDLFFRMEQHAETVGESIPIAVFTNDPAEINIDALDPNESNLIVYDDCALELSKAVGKNINAAFMRARKKNATLIFITQDIFVNNIKFIRMQCNYLYLFNISNTKNVRSLGQEIGKVTELLAAFKDIKPNEYVRINKQTGEIGLAEI